MDKKSIIDGLMNHDDIDNKTRIGPPEEQVYAINEDIIDCLCKILSQFKDIEGGTIQEWHRRCRDYYFNRIHHSDYLYMEGSAFPTEAYNMIAWNMRLRSNMDFKYYHNPVSPVYLAREEIMGRRPLRTLRKELHEFTTSAAIAMYSYWLLYDGGLEWIVCRIQRLIQQNEYIREHPEAKEVYVNWQRWIISYSIKYGLESKRQWADSLWKLYIATPNCNIDLVALGIKEEEHHSYSMEDLKEASKVIQDLDDGLIDELLSNYLTEGKDDVSMEMLWDGSVFLTSEESRLFSSLSNLAAIAPKSKERDKKLSAYKNLEDIMVTKPAYEYYVNACGDHPNGEFLARLTVVFEECNALKVDNIDGAVTWFFKLIKDAGIGRVSVKTFQNHYRLWHHQKHQVQCSM